MARVEVMMRKVTSLGINSRNSCTSSAVGRRIRQSLLMSTDCPSQNDEQNIVLRTCLARRHADCDEHNSNNHGSDAVWGIGVLVRHFAVTFEHRGDLERRLGSDRRGIWPVNHAAKVVNPGPV